ncbi:major facilitator superfamily domain-containing protein [Crucibulum laeve]|uniref:Major facilitator superfamily domain-containing protein n=1 Tax=Crucibulum laeve TaxID=68775 RepID=A0A5C3LTC2_9AGAR|nr:major facilitator superfamily domain-containing protein [Crucibulum laeve]
MASESKQEYEQRRISTANNNAVSISLPTIGRELNLDESELQWIVGAYPLSSGCLLLVCGRLADVFGRKKIFLLGSIILATFTLACGLTKNVMLLYILRGIQGVGVAGMVPAALGILADSFPPSPKRSLAFATFSSGSPVGAIFGTAIGGALTEFTKTTWRSPFYLHAALTFLLCFVGGWYVIDPDRSPSIQGDESRKMETGVSNHRYIDWIGAILATTGLILILFVISQGEIAPRQWKTTYIIALLVVGILLIGLFLLWQWYLEKHQENANSPPPLMKLSIWTHGQGRFAAMMAIAFFNLSTFYAWSFWVQLYYQKYKSYSTIQTVIRLSPMFVSGLLCNAFVGVLAARVRLVYLLAFGNVSTAIASLLFAIIQPEASYWCYGFPSATLGVIGADFTYATGTLFVAKVSRQDEQSLAGGLFQTMAQTGTAVGVTITTVIFNRVSGVTQSTTVDSGHSEDILRGYKAAEWGGVAFGLVATLLSIMFFRRVGTVGDRKPNHTEDSEASIHVQGENVKGVR